MEWSCFRAVVIAGSLLCAGASPARAQSSSPFTLHDALRIARTQAPAIAAEQARARAAHDAVGRVAVMPNPLVEVRVENWGAPATSALPRDAFFTASQAIELGGKLGARRGLADALARSARTSVSLAEQAALVDVANLYLQSVAARERQRLTQQHAAELAELLRIMERRVAAGAAAESELFRLTSEEARIARDAVMAELEASRSVAKLSARLGMPVARDVLVMPPVPPVPAAPDESSLLDRRADVLAAREAVATARQHLRVESARRTPDLTLHGGVVRSGGSSAGIAAVSIPLPLFDRNQEARARAEGEVRARQAELDGSEQWARGDIAATRAAARALESQARAIRNRLVAPATAAREAALAAFQSGAIDMVRLLDAERMALDAALIALQLEIDSVVAAIDARVAMGESLLP
jgi:cobalt-zinc-cadmium efflux system outer membrane protein